jgi:site-specific DNA-cytosine methylase
MKALELYAGLGGFAAAAGHAVEVAAALDAGAHVLAVYAHNFPHPAVQCNLEGLRPEALAAFEADLWWMSPPCQPYTVRGNQQDLEDPRAASFLRILEAIPAALPSMIALENVNGFLQSRARQALLDALTRAGYDYVECEMCPTELGIPNRRPRYYLAATRTGSLRALRRRRVGKPLPAYLDPRPEESLFLPAAVIERYGSAFHPIEIDDAEGTATCFTSAYGRSWTCSGSYLRYADGRVRLFSGKEILRLHHFPDGYAFPKETDLRQHWKYAGNSVNVAVVREVLHVLGLPVLPA